MSGTIYTTKADAYIGSQLKDLAFLEGLSFELVSDAEETRIEFADTVEVHRANVLDITLKMFQRIQAWGAENVNGFYKTGKNRGDGRSITSNQTDIV